MAENRTRSPDEIQRDIERAREDLVTAVHEIEQEARQRIHDARHTIDRAKRELQWRTHIRRQPGISIGIAAAFGFLLGFFGGSRVRGAPPELELFEGQ